MNWIKDTIEYISQVFKWYVFISPWEKGIRLRLGNRQKLLEPGTHFRIPFIDAVYIQPVRVRVCHLSAQTATSMDGHAVTFAIAVGYSISDIEKLYNSVNEPERTIANIVQGEATHYIASNNLLDCKPQILSEEVTRLLKDKADYGLDYSYIRVVSYAVVRTYRIINDNYWLANDLNLNVKS
jgi:regulator of protease activity HflC (stomatin/prohibitin superfamily)